MKAVTNANKKDCYRRNKDNCPLDGKSLVLSIYLSIYLSITKSYKSELLYDFLNNLRKRLEKKSEENWSDMEPELCSRKALKVMATVKEY